MHQMITLLAFNGKMVMRLNLTWLRNTWKWFWNEHCPSCNSFETTRYRYGIAVCSVCHKRFKWSPRP